MKERKYVVNGEEWEGTWKLCSKLGSHEVVKKIEEKELGEWSWRRAWRINLKESLGNEVKEIEDFNWSVDIERFEFTRFESYLKENNAYPYICCSFVFKFGAYLKEKYLHIHSFSCSSFASVIAPTYILSWTMQLLS